MAAVCSATPIEKTRQAQTIPFEKISVIAPRDDITYPFSSNDICATSQRKRKGSGWMGIPPTGAPARAPQKVPADRLETTKDSVEEEMA